MGGEERKAAEEEAMEWFEREMRGKRERWIEEVKRQSVLWSLPMSMRPRGWFQLPS